MDHVAAASAASAAPSQRTSYDPYMASRDADAHMRAHSLDGLYTSQLPAKKRTRQKMYPSEEARQAAKMLQKARRREQNRNAQRRLRDRKEEHIFKVGDQATLSRPTSINIFSSV